MENHFKPVTLSLSKGELPNSNTANESKAIPSPPIGGDVPTSRDRGGLDFPWCITFLEKRGKELYGQKFKIYEQDHNIIYKLIIYFIGNKPEADKIGLDLDKGILLTGPVGCGKTTLMNLMRFVPPPERNHIMKSCRDVSFEFIQEGYEVINRYSKMSFNNSHPKIYCFDDLGAEQSLKYYGNECNIMAEILLSRYDLFVSQNMLTHITTNLSASEIENAYGSRLRSRMREMFNLIAFEGKMLDKRI
jgi:ATPase family associated with various cellular activities (AAA)